MDLEHVQALILDDASELISGGWARAFAAEWARAVPLTLGLCERVMANCFVNQSYDPSRNGTCPTKIFEFHDLGFERENLLRGFPVDYRFH